MSDLYYTIARGVVCELHFFTGLNFAGVRTVVRIFHDARKQGPDVDPTRVKSVALSAPYGTRVTFCAGPEVAWADHPWRSVVFQRDLEPYKMREGLPVIQIPDLDAVDGVQAARNDPENWVGWPTVARLEDGRGWTYGRCDPDRPLKAHLKGVRFDKVDEKPPR